jgi:hypothetical protein
MKYANVGVSQAVDQTIKATLDDKTVLRFFIN